MVAAQVTSPTVGAGFNSSELTFLSTLVHPMAAEGEFIWRLTELDSGARSVINVKVSAASSEFQIDIDLSGVVDSTILLPSSVELALGGYLVLSQSAEGGRFLVDQVSYDDEGAVTVEYSNSGLQQGDVYALVLLDDGIFDLTNSENGTVAEVAVTVPDGKSDIEEATEITASAAGFAPQAVSVDVGGSLSVTVDAADAVLVLEKR